MFEISKATHKYYKVTKNNETIQITANLKCITDVLIIDKKRYIRVEVKDGLLDFLCKLSNFCSNKFDNFTSIVTNDSISVKLPFRYNKYEIKYIGQASSDDLKDGSNIKCTIEVSGVVQSKYSSMCTFKLIQLEESK